MIASAILAIACGPTIQAPEHWTEAEFPPSEILAVFYNPDPDLHDDLPFTAKITVAAEVAPDLTLEEYVASSNQLIPVLVPHSKAATTSLSELDGQPAYFIDATFRRGALPLRSRQLCLAAKDGKFYVVTAMALEAHWHKYADAFDHSLLSFRP